MNPPRNRKGESGNLPPTANASEFYPNHCGRIVEPDQSDRAEIWTWICQITSGALRNGFSTRQ